MQCTKWNIAFSFLVLVPFPFTHVGTLLPQNEIYTKKEGLWRQLFRMDSVYVSYLICGKTNYVNSRSHIFGKNCVKAKKLLNSWFDEIFYLILPVSQSHFGKLKNLLSPKFFSRQINSLVIYLVIAITKFLPKKRESKFP